MPKPATSVAAYRLVEWKYVRHIALATLPLHVSPDRGGTVDAERPQAEAWGVAGTLGTAWRARSQLMGKANPRCAEADTRVFPTSGVLLR